MKGNLNKMTSAMASDVVDNATVDRGGNNDPLTHIVGEIKATTTTKATETKQNSATPNLINSNSTSTSTSKIPYPLATMLIGKTNQFRRSASTRLRETKTNLLFLPQRMANNNNSNNTPQSQFAAATNEAQMGKEKETNINTTTHTSLPNEKSTQDCESSIDSVLCIHNDTTSNNAGNRPISTRRKLTLHSLSPAIRSLSLNSTRNDTTITGNNNSSKLTLKKNDSLDSEINRSNGCNVLEQKCVVKKSNQNGDIIVKLPETKLTSTIQQQRGNFKKIMNEELSSSPPPGPPLPQQPTRKRDPNKMSLNLNGSITTNRPVAVTTATSNTSTTTTTTSSSSAPTPPTIYARTPKTPNYKLPLETVPETKLTPKTPPVTPDSPSTYLEDDLDSLYSFATTTSGRSTMSCDHPYVARNGTTFSGRKMKYVVHCSNYAGQVGEDYLTPTQRAQRQIRRLRELLCSARNDLEQKDSEILRLTREVVELRLFKASLSSPEDRSNSSDAVTVREADLKTSQDVSPIVDMVDDGMKSSTPHYVAGGGGAGGDGDHNQHHLHLQHHHNLHSSEMQSSFADSGHFEDMTTSSVHSKDSSFAVNTNDMACGSDEGCDDSPHNLDTFKEQRQELIRMYEQRIEELIKTQDSASSDMKRTHNDRVEALLQKLAECNTRYADIVPDYEHAKERIRELEKQLDDLQRKLFEHEEKQNKMYLHMYQKGQEAERISRADQALELAHRTPNKVSISELLHQLQSTQDELENIRAAECRKECGSNHALLTAKEAISLWVLGARKTIYRRLLDAQKNKTHVDPEVTLQFLKSAVYYFLTDKENSQGHLQAIESILEFTEAEKQDISKARSNK